MKQGLTQSHEDVDDENLVPVASILQTAESCKEITESEF